VVPGVFRAGQAQEWWPSREVADRLREWREGTRGDVDDEKAKNTVEAHDFKSSLSCLVHSRYDWERMFNVRTLIPYKAYTCTVGIMISPNINVPFFTPSLLLYTLQGLWQYHNGN
jgi:hypothetical protein